MLLMDLAEHFSYG